MLINKQSKEYCPITDLHRDAYDITYRIDRTVIKYTNITYNYL